MRPLIDECLNALVQKLEIISESCQESKMKRIFGAYSMEVILQVEFGIKVNVLFNKTNPIIRYAKIHLNGI
jgi:acid phosphatase family membrane protein YuiD